MSLFLVTGMSGAGKSSVISTMEDLGYFCVDNVPPQFLLPMANLAAANEAAHDLALVIDARSHKLFEKLNEEISKLNNNGIEYKLIFIDCEDDVILKRFKETRRKHPLMNNDNISIEEAIKEERKMLIQLREKSDFLIDSTDLNNQALKDIILGICQNAPLSRLQIKVVSFGFKFGIVNDADIVFDVRCLPNPFYIDELKNKTGLDKEVYDYVFSFEKSKDLAEKLKDILDFSVPLYIEEGKSQLVIAIGCTGGKHRSISFARYLYENLKYDNVNIQIFHRDIDKHI